MKGAKQTMCYQKLKNIPKNEFSIHGLWPGNLTGDYVADCNGNLTTEMIEEAKKKEGDFFNEKMKKYWVSYSESDEDFWIHEYTKHGYCYTNKMKENDFLPYFKKAMPFFLDNGFNDFFLKAFPGVEKKTLTISKEDLRKIVMPFIRGIILISYAILKIQNCYRKYIFTLILISFPIQCRFLSVLIAVKKKNLLILYLDNVLLHCLMKH